MNQILLSATLASALLGGCVSRGNDPGWEYAPDMYYSKGYEPYSQADSSALNPYGMSMRTPAVGSVAMGKSDYVYPYENNGAGYELAGAELTMPEGFSDADGRGQYLYDIYCAPCHGAKGNNDGAVFQKAANLKPAWKGYSDPYIQTLPVGKIYHTLTYGKNNMGSHASVLAPLDRWKVINYVKQLSMQSAAAPAASATENAASEMETAN
ncbi:MAG: c-type cytochrome [Bacteroidia bacterium]